MRWALLLLSGFGGTAAAAEPTFPRVQGKVGESVTYKKVQDFSGNKSEQTLKLTLSEKTAKEATVKTQAQMPGFRLPEIPITNVPADGDLDPAALADQVFAKLDAKPDATDVGRETVTAGGKAHECQTATVKTTVGEGAGAVTTVTRFWYCKEVPVVGLVKLETTKQLPGGVVIKTTLTLVGPDGK
jgi:hypothetical protein